MTAAYDPAVITTVTMGIPPQVPQNLRQKMYDARAAVSLHTRRIDRLERTLGAIDVLSVCVPILFLSVQFIPAKPVQDAAKIVGDIVSVALLALVVFSFVRGLRPKLAEHRELLRRNVEQEKDMLRAYQAPAI